MDREPLEAPRVPSGHIYRTRCGCVVLVNGEKLRCNRGCVLVRDEREGFRCVERGPGCQNEVAPDTAPPMWTRARRVR